MEGRSPARVYALLMGGTLVAAGVLGFFYNSSFDTGDARAGTPCSGCSM